MQNISLDRNPQEQKQKKYQLKPHIRILFQAVENRYLVKQSDSKYFEVSADLAKILERFRTPVVLQELYHSLVADGLEMTWEEFEDFFETSLLGKGFFTHEEETPASSVLWFKWPFLSENFVRRLSTIFVFLYRPWIALFVLSTSIMLIGFNFFPIVNILKSASDITLGLSYQEIILLYVLFFLVSVFHELGHISALKSYGRQASQVGIGFYLIFLVFYSNVTQSWELEAKKRIVVNLGGVYFELVAFFLLAILHFSTEFLSQQLFLFFTASLIASILSNLLPLLRSDGYWILSDLFGTGGFSKDYFMDLTKKIFKKNAYSLRISLNLKAFESKKDVAVFVYYVFSGLFLLFSFVYMVWFLTHYAVSYPTWFQGYWSQVTVPLARQNIVEKLGLTLELIVKTSVFTIVPLSLWTFLIQPLWRRLNKKAPGAT